MSKPGRLRWEGLAEGGRSDQRPQSGGEQTWAPAPGGAGFPSGCCAHQENFGAEESNDLTWVLDSVLKRSCLGVERTQQEGQKERLVETGPLSGPRL